MATRTDQLASDLLGFISHGHQVPGGWRIAVGIGEAALRTWEATVAADMADPVMALADGMGWPFRTAFLAASMPRPADFETEPGRWLRSGFWSTPWAPGIAAISSSIRRVSLPIGAVRASIWFSSGRACSP